MCLAEVRAQDCLAPSSLFRHKMVIAETPDELLNSSIEYSVYCLTPKSFLKFMDYYLLRKFPELKLSPTSFSKRNGVLNRIYVFSLPKGQIDERGIFYLDINNGKLYVSEWLLNSLLDEHKTSAPWAIETLMGWILFPDEKRLNDAIKHCYDSFKIAQSQSDKNASTRADPRGDLTLQDVMHAGDQLLPYLGTYIQDTPTLLSPRLSALFGMEIWLQLETEQEIRSYKIWGIFNMMLDRVKKHLVEKGLLDSQRAQKLTVEEMTHLPGYDNAVGDLSFLAASAGNLAQAVAYLSHIFRVKSKIYVNQTIPQIKETAILRFGGPYVRLDKAYKDYNDAYAHASAASDPANYRIFISSSDDPMVGAGHGVVGLKMFSEMTKQGYRPNIVIAGLGTGLFSYGINTAIKALDEKVYTVGVESEEADVVALSMLIGRNIKLESVKTLADGTAVTYASPWTTERLAKRLDMVSTVEEIYIKLAISLLHDEGFTAEGAGALSLALLMRDQDMIRKKFKNPRVVLMISGANIDPAAHQRILNEMEKNPAVQRLRQIQGWTAREILDEHRQNRPAPVSPATPPKMENFNLPELAA